jgi:hypothetical protein
MPSLHPLQPQVGLLQPVLQVHWFVQPQVAPQLAVHPPVQVPVQPFVQLQAQLTKSLQEGWQGVGPSVQGLQPQPESGKHSVLCGNTLIIKSVTLNVAKMSSLGWTKKFQPLYEVKLNRNGLELQDV